jgi:leader peptidase (prepilin peptidase) / N-methyltransferase
VTFDLNFDFAWLGPLYLVAVSWPLTAIDVRERRLPNRLTLPVFPVAIFGHVLAIAFGAEPGRLWSSLIASALAFVFALVLNRTAGLGMGDVKLIAGITLALAWFHPFLPAIALLIALISAGAVSIAMLALRKTRMGSSIALGPYLLAGYVVTLIFQALP